ncbi:unnamed protein product [Pleuronectes platessa]|uniref:Uncharacterized protein n=1 Tax=Pleuronectes platessa TaxID=8262 RepID=A0A9N7VHK1_PLEPL|nr:unnamed protein product [Pleuronectes platessa]
MWKSTCIPGMEEFRTGSARGHLTRVPADGAQEAATLLLGCNPVLHLCVVISVFLTPPPTHPLLPSSSSPPCPILLLLLLASERTADHEERSSHLPGAGGVVSSQLRRLSCLETSAQTSATEPQQKPHEPHSDPLHSEDAAMPPHREEDPSPSRRLGLAPRRLHAPKPGHDFP